GAGELTSPNRSRLLPTSVTLLSGRTLAIARFGWREVGPRQRAGRGGWRLHIYGVSCPLPTLPRMRGGVGAGEGDPPPRIAFGNPTLPLQGRVDGLGLSAVDPGHPNHDRHPHHARADRPRVPARTALRSASELHRARPASPRSRDRAASAACPRRSAPRYGDCRDATPNAP